MEKGENTEGVLVLKKKCYFSHNLHLNFNHFKQTYNMGKYDRIVKESLSKLVIPLAKRLGINVENIEIIKDKLQYTIEREPDFLAIIKHKDPEDDYVFQMDFQVPNDETMPERVLLYRNLIRLF